LTAKLETGEKALADERYARLIADRSLADERTARQAANQSLRTSQEANVALNLNLQSAWASIIASKEKLSSKSAALDEAGIQEREAQIKLQILADEKNAKEYLLESVQMALSKRDFTSSTMSSLAVAHAMPLVKSHMPDLDAEILR
jgi:hypothetical protein